LGWEDSKAARESINQAMALYQQQGFEGQGT